ncbi:AP endonuclease [Ramaria rubella]|nr:AP endonuclease [Ramaria rubella]
MASSLRRSARSLTIANTSFISSPDVATSTMTTHPRKRARIAIAGVESEKHASASALHSGVTESNNTRMVSKRKDVEMSRPEDYPKRAQIEWKVGAHVSAAGGVENAIINAASIGANAFALFVKSQRKWTSAPLTEQSIATFRDRLMEFDYAPELVLPHGSYLINLGNPDEEKREKSYSCFLDDLKRCEQLGLTRYNFHPGSTVGASTKEESINHIATCLNRAHKETSTVMTVIENMAGSGNVLGSRFEEIAQIIHRIDDKTRVGVCIDTCHAFAAGYDIRSKEAYENTLSAFARIVGLEYLRGMHLNDSKTPFNSHKDRHDNIGRGHISLEAFGHIMRDPRLQNIPLILETPTKEESSIWQKEIQVLNELSISSPDDSASIQRMINDIGTAVARTTKMKGNNNRNAGNRVKRKREKGEDGGNSDSDLAESS